MTLTFLTKMYISLFLKRVEIGHVWETDRERPGHTLEKDFYIDPLLLNHVDSIFNVPLSTSASRPRRAKGPLSLHPLWTLISL